MFCRQPVVSVDLEASMTRCPCCSVKLFTLYGIVHHLRKHERQRKVKSTYHCSVCNLSWPTISELEAHARTVHRKRHSSAKEKLGVVEAAAKPRRTGKNKASTSGSGSGNPDLTSFEFTTHRFPLMEKLYRPTEKNKSHSHSHADARDSPYFVCDECGMYSVTSEQSNLHRLMHDARRVASGSSSADSSLNDVNIQEHMEEAEFMLMFDMQVAPSSAPESMEEDQGNAPAVAEPKKEINILKNPKNLQFDANQNVVPTTDPNVVKVNLPSRHVASGSENLISADLLETQKKAAQGGRKIDRLSIVRLPIMELSQSNQELPGYPLQSLIQMSSSTGSADRWSNFKIEPDQTDDQPLDFSLKSGPKVLPSSSDFNRSNFAIHSGGDIQETSPNQRESFKHLEMAVFEMETNPPLPNYTTLRSVLCSPFSLNIPNSNESQYNMLYRDYYNSRTNRYHCPTCGVPFKHGFKVCFQFFSVLGFSSH